jgi:glycosyltransferase involved in cell wall biosynthesis
MYGTPPWRRFGRTRDGYVLMINPCAVKGIDLFLALAARFPSIEFAGLAGWGTTPRDRERMRQTPNVRVLETVPDIEDVLREARVLLMPSVWYEGFGLIAMEAMLRGLPVIASDSGGLQEAKRGTGYVIPVRPVERYEREFDETGMPRAVIPPQDLEPWAAALRELLEDESAYRAEADRARLAAEHFVRWLDMSDFARMMEIMPVSREPLVPPAAVKSMDSARQALLLERLRRKQP